MEEALDGTKRFGPLSPRALQEGSSHQPGKGQPQLTLCAFPFTSQPFFCRCPWQPEFSENSKVTMRSCSMLFQSAEDTI